MNLAQAFELAKTGAKIARSGWAVDEFTQLTSITATDGAMPGQQKQARLRLDKMIGEVTTMNWTPLLDDMEAQDWEERP